jgi:hypothetical protein
MKKLSEVLPNIEAIAKEQGKNSLTCSDGSGTTGGSAIIPKPKPQIAITNSLTQMRDKAIRIRSAIQSKRPKKSFEWEKTEAGAMRRVEVTTQPDMTEAEAKYLTEASMPASQQTVIDWLFRLASHKRMHSDVENQTTRIVDTSDLIYGVTEHALVIAVVGLIESHESDWFPTIKVMQDSIKENEAKLHD